MAFKTQYDNGYDKLVYEGNAFLLHSYTEKINKKFS